MTRSKTFSACLCFLLAAAFARPVHADSVAVIYNDQTVKLDKAVTEGTNLWVTPEDLTRINGFKLKPEGACLDEVCIPISPEMVKEEGGQKLFNVTALAKKLGQPYVFDAGENVWSFGLIPAKLGGYLNSAIAPDFALPDRKGKIVHLSDFRGKKVLIITWASW